MIRKSDGMEEKNIVLVDVFDHKIGMSTKREVHRMGKLHRAFSVFLYHNDMMLIQKRAMSKYHSGGLWSNACCSHPTTDKSALLYFAQQRMHEELKITCPVEEVFQFTYFHQFSDELFEYEYDHVFIGEYEGDFRLNEAEADDAKWISFHELASLLTEYPQLFSVWCLIAMPKVMTIINERQR
jgi:Isopentenyldiphosphate isomerase